MAFLVVDDSQIVRSIVLQALHLYGFKDVVEACDGADGLRKYCAQVADIDMCILDVNMPEMDGISLAGEIRKRNSHIPIVILTTESDRTKMMQARQLGANGWIIKPFQAEKFIEVVKMLLQAN